MVLLLGILAMVASSGGLCRWTVKKGLGRDACCQLGVLLGMPTGGT